MINQNDLVLSLSAVTDVVERETKRLSVCLSLSLSLSLIALVGEERK